MTSSRIITELFRLIPREQLPVRWAAELARTMVADLPASTVDLAQERIVELGEGIRLAHVRTASVEQCLIAGYRATDVDSAPQADWLWLVVLMPEGEVARHLGWLAHLASVLRDEDNLRRLKLATNAQMVAEIFQALLAVDPVKTSRFARAAKGQTTSNATQRMIVAVLKGDEAVDQLLTMFVEHDVRGATILDGVGMGEHLAAHLSLFAGFRMAFKAVGRSHVVIAVVPAERSDEVLELARLAITGSGGGTGVAWAIDLAGFIAPGGG